MVERLMETLSERERTILHLRFFEHLSQEEISQKIGISQVHVSRLIRASLDRLRERVSSDSELTVDRKEVP
jgi:RNA polymerase sigma-B factor